MPPPGAPNCEPHYWAEPGHEDPIAFCTKGKNIYVVTSGTVCRIYSSEVSSFPVPPCPTFTTRIPIDVTSAHGTRARRSVWATLTDGTAIALCVATTCRATAIALYVATTHRAIVIAFCVGTTPSAAAIVDICLPTAHRAVAIANCFAYNISAIVNCCPCPTDGPALPSSCIYLMGPSKSSGDDGCCGRIREDGWRRLGTHDTSS
ncbi:hypothetical protein DFH08DRAFT_971527 [Mycena albidolilacea]|uniref:Uncharacterized protein n=1 Tax=Mycena albidolilacea TaxID=1033008 RepID=A0AAD7EEA2_9AGAR|nr:hypothetical protein DFH08DRAFT_971527 [Mycena albidolilacea]